MSSTVSRKYQVVIPRDVRRRLGIKPGQKMHMEATADGKVLLEKDTSASVQDLIAAYAGSIKSSDTAWGKASMDATTWLRAARDNDWK